MHNLIQVEFFLVDIRADSLRSLINEAVDRVRDGSRIKLCLRFYEDGNAISLLVKEVSLLNKRRDEIDDLLPLAGWFRRRRLWRERERLVLQKDTLRAQKWRLVLKQLEIVIQTEAPLAVEDREHRFREARPEEKHEFLEAAKSADVMWLYIFSYNHLLADKLNLIGTIALGE